MSEALRDLVAKVIDTGKKGSLTLTVSVEPMPNSDGNALVVKDEIKLKLPEFARDASLFFADDDRNVPAIYPNGFDPIITSSIDDVLAVAGVRTSLVRAAPSRAPARHGRRGRRVAGTGRGEKFIYTRFGLGGFGGVSFC